MRGVLAAHSAPCVRALSETFILCLGKHYHKLVLSGIMARDRRPPPRGKVQGPIGETKSNIEEDDGQVIDVGGHLLIESSGMRKDEKKCPYCDEIIKKAAKKCRWCMEWLTTSGRRG